MPSLCKKRNTGCPVTFALDAFGDRWSLVIIRDMIMHRKETYGEFLESDEGIATNILADRLKHLETEGIILKSRDPENRRRYIYRLTEKGVNLTPVMLELILWSARYDPETKAPREFIDSIESNRAGFIADVRARVLGE